MGISHNNRRIKQAGANRESFWPTWATCARKEVEALLWVACNLQSTSCAEVVLCYFLVPPTNLYFPPTCFHTSDKVKG